MNISPGQELKLEDLVAKDLNQVLPAHSKKGICGL
jgi:hypothetical protein